MKNQLKTVPDTVVESSQNFDTWKDKHLNVTTPMNESLKPAFYQSAESSVEQMPITDYTDYTLN